MPQTTHPAKDQCLDNEMELPLEGNYFVSTYPPFSSWKKEAAPEALQVLNNAHSLPTDDPIGIYVHIPFCTIRCLFCYYLSYAKQSDDLILRYIKALGKELSLYRELMDFSTRRIKFAYFGGGTPSILSADQINTLLEQLKHSAPWIDAEEITFECAPKSITKEKLKTLRDNGITRISMGVQQLDDEVLKKNGRVHLVSDIERAYELIQESRFDIVNLDLIVGLIGENDQTFFGSVEKMIKMNPESVTIYQLEIPQNTPLYRLHQEDRLKEAPAPWKLKRNRLKQGFERLEQAGYKLRSAYTAVRGDVTKPFVYQDEQYRGADLIGLGAASFSSYSGTNYQNIARLQSYLECVESGHLPIGRACTLSKEEQFIREFILQLKLGKVDADYFSEKFDVDIFTHFSDKIDPLVDKKLLQKEERQLKLTRNGLLQVDHLLPHFYLPEHQGIRYS